MDLGFTVTEDMAEKPDVQYKQPKNSVHGRTHDGYTRHDIHRRLLHLAITQYQSSLHASMTVAITAVLTAFWSQWREL